MNLLLSLKLLLILFFVYETHPFHVSICEMSYNGKTGCFEISYRIFTDDFEVALAGISKDKMDLLIDFESEKSKLLINDYLNQHFEIWIEGQKIALNYLGSEHVDDAIWNYLESEKIEFSSPIKIVNDVLFEIFSDQMNLIHLNKEDKKRSFRFDRDNPEVEF